MGTSAGLRDDHEGKKSCVSQPLTDNLTFKYWLDNRGMAQILATGVFLHCTITFGKELLLWKSEANFHFDKKPLEKQQYDGLLRT